MLLMAEMYIVRRAKRRKKQAKNRKKYFWKKSPRPGDQGMALKNTVPVYTTRPPEKCITTLHPRWSHFQKKLAVCKKICLWYT